MVVVEDIHWADEATIDLLRFLGRRIRDATVLLIVTYRDDGLAAGDPLQLALGDLATQRSVRRISLGPLSAGAVQVMAGGSEREARDVFSEMATVSPSARNHTSESCGRPSGPTVASVPTCADSRSRWESGIALITASSSVPVLVAPPGP